MSKSQSPTPLSKKIKVSLTFPDAMEAVIRGAVIKRVEWQDKDEYGILKDNFLMIHRDGKFHTWIVSEGDMLATDWIAV